MDYLIWQIVTLIGQGMLPIEMLVADSPVHGWKAALVISKAILAKAIPPGGAPGLYDFRRCGRRVGYSEIAHDRCDNTIPDQIFPQLNSLRTIWGQKSAEESASSSANPSAAVSDDTGL